MSSLTSQDSHFIRVSDRAFLYLDPDVDQDWPRFRPRNILPNFDDLIDNTLVISATTVLKVDSGIRSVRVLHDYLVLLVRI